MADISQTTFWNAFPWIFKFRSQFHWSLFLRPGVHWGPDKARTRCGMQNLKIRVIRQLVRIFLKDSFQCLYCPGTLPRVAFLSLRERANFPRRDFGPEQNLDAEMNFGTPSADCLHCPANIFRTTRLSSVLLHLPQTILEASAWRTASRMF